MAKVKYYYNPDTLSYQKIHLRKREKFRNFLLMLLASLILMFLGYVVFTSVFESPKEKELKRQLEFVKLNEQLHSKRIKQIESVLSEVQDRDNNIYRLYFEVNPIPKEQRKAGFGGVNRYKSLEGFNNSEMIIDVTKNMDILAKQLYIQSKSLDEIVKLADNKEKLLAAIPAIQPVKKGDLKRMASGYGWRTDPFTKARKKHYGMDFSAPIGTPVYATGDGIVKRVDQRASGFGKHIEINHGFGYITLYAHLSKYNVRKGQRVKRGDLIGFVGTTGRSQGPHLHYEVHKNGVKVNPINYYYGNLSPQEFIAMQKAAQMEGQSLD
ncbi:peptidoglycan DD-metalloendopeptidase family protein [Lutibacter sp.]|uniref:M23 family metallopeptidase n=1 Tax=Lutibacter sp. TaxID=1925666 RepID=UPI0025BE1F45|nr:peptidoglycan DD-metalloendopeptidase family protein [Lutibacter sp.]MCF6181297.1 peptidoglycan DD-metalloendopeptidase family protein [Lutibacter sp.]